VVVADLRAQGQAVIPRTRSRLFLGAGALIGLSIAGRELLGRDVRSLGPDVMAMVGDVPIARDEYQRALAAVAADRKGPPDAALRRHVLDRLVDEELLVQAALQSGLAARDPLLRGQLASAMIDTVLGDKLEPSDAELRAHFDAHREVFARNGRVTIQAWWFRADGKRRAEDARPRVLAGDPVTADAPAIVLPTGPIPALKLADYLGGQVAAAVAALPVGAVTEPIASGEGAWLVRVAARTDGEIPAFEAVRELVFADLRRSRDDEALRRWLERRRRETRVTVGPLP
jgi:hypothetical protein